MVCGTCGREIKNTARFCPYCGMNQLDNSEYESIDPKDKKKFDIKLADVFSVIGAALACVAFAVSLYAFNITNDTDRGVVFYSLGFLEYCFFATFVLALIMVSIKERTLLGKAVMQFSTMTILMVLLKMIGSIILNLAVFFEYLLPRFNFEDDLGFSILFVLIFLLLCIIGIAVCNIISSRRNLAHKKIGSAIPYILMGTFAVLAIQQIVYDALLLNQYLLESVLNINVFEVTSVTSYIFSGIVWCCIVAVILFGFISKDEIRKFLCGTVLMMFFAVEFMIEIISLVSYSGMDETYFIVLAIHLAFILLSGLMIFLSIRKIKKKN